MKATDKFADLKKRIWFLVGALIVYRIGSFITVPGVNPAELVNQTKGGIFELFNMFSGGSFSRLSIFAIGIMPYISASIVIQLGAEILPSLKELKKEGESGKRKMTQYTRYATVLLATIQATIFAISHYGTKLVIVPKAEFVFTTVVVLVTGTLFLMWLGEQITERGIGNGISMIICAGIASGIPPAIIKTLALARDDVFSPVFVVFLFAMVLLVTAAVVYVEKGQRKILVNYAKKQVGNRVMQGQSTHLPLKVNMAGVIPPIFASSLILLPTTAATTLGKSENLSWLKDIADGIHPGQPIYALLLASLILFFSFFYTALVFSPKETADNLKRSGAFVPGIRPGEQTARYLEKIILRLTLIGGLYITAVCLLPELIHLKYNNVPFYFGGTSLLIIVVVVIDFIAQLQSYIMTQQYEGLLKKANFRSGLGVSR